MQTWPSNVLAFLFSLSLETGNGTKMRSMCVWACFSFFFCSESVIQTSHKKAFWRDRTTQSANYVTIVSRTSSNVTRISPSVTHASDTTFWRRSRKMLSKEVEFQQSRLQKIVATKAFAWHSTSYMAVRNFWIEKLRRARGETPVVMSKILLLANAWHFC